ncbi:hypothetical protein [Longirhabdus pacifica]|uniref:hypothetical protein n=1 Tax=Longirhabdus pacifica TaxID=2305227 RepID=UPI001008AFE6|nr:hypothetical protein [Longirhabdus pacifica]
MIKVNAIENASALNVGQNLLADWNNSDKRNQGFGSNQADHTNFLAPKSFVDDRDLIDSPATFESSCPKHLMRKD